MTCDPSPVTYCPLELSIGEAEVRRLLPRWNVGDLVRLPGEGGGSANPAVVVETAGGRFFLKRRNPRYSAPEMLRHDHALMEHLSAKGLPTPLALLTRDGERWAEADRKVYELYPYLPGKAYDRTSEAQLREAGRRLADFHRAADDFQPPPGKAWPRYHDPANSLAGLEWAARLLAEQAGPTRAGREPAEALQGVERLAEIARSLAQRFPDDAYWACSVVLAHGDWHPANVKYQDDRVCGIFDPDWATRQPRLVDIADGVMYFAARRPGGLDAADIRTLTRAFTLDEERTRTFTEAYEGEGALEPGELNRLPDFLLARWLYSRIDPMRRKIPQEEAIDYLLEGIWGPIGETQRFYTTRDLFTGDLSTSASGKVV